MSTLTKTPKQSWAGFLAFAEEHCSTTEFNNWFAPINVLEETGNEISLEVQNVFVQEYLLRNYAGELAQFVPRRANGELALTFVVKESPKTLRTQEVQSGAAQVPQGLKLNPLYTFDHFIEGTCNQFVKSAAQGVAKRPGKTYNPLFIYGGVGLGKTHLLHAIGHELLRKHKHVRVQCITTEGFINDLVDHLRNKSIDRMKRFYRSLDVLLVDDIQFLQSRLNFEEEFCNTFESLINQNKQIVITSDKPPTHLKLSERLIGRMEWGLVAHVSVPDVETRAAILQHKAEQRGLRLPHRIAFFIAEHIYNNVRQLEGALNRLNACAHWMDAEITEDMVKSNLAEMLSSHAHKKISVDSIMTCVASLFEVKLSDLRSPTRTKGVALARQVAMYLAKEMIQESLTRIASAFGGKAHSTLLHAWKKISGQLSKDDGLRRQIDKAKRNLAQD